MGVRCFNFKAYVAEVPPNKLFLIITCSTKTTIKVKKCLGVEMGSNEIACVGNDVRAQLPVQPDKEILLKGLQSYGNWLSKRLEERKARVGYAEEMLIKYLTYMMCKHKGGAVVECLKSSSVVTRRGKIGWKAIYQMFVNARDLPRDVAPTDKWSADLPRECILTTSAA